MPRLAAVRVADLDAAVGVFDLALGSAHTRAVTGEPNDTTSSDPTSGGLVTFRSLRCWGANEHGQLGTGDRDDRAHPALVVMTDQPRLAQEPA